MIPSFSSRECHISIIKHGAKEDIAKMLGSISEGCLKTQILKAISYCIKSIVEESCNITLPVTLPWHKCIVEEDRVAIAESISRNKQVQKSNGSGNSITAHIKNGFVLTVNFHGESVFAKPNFDDSFDSVESLTQRVTKIEIKKPKIEKKTLRRSTHGRK